MELRIVPPMGQATVRIQDRDVPGEDFPQLRLPIRVFNRDFVSESVFPIGGGAVPLIFVVGKESAEKQKQINRLKSECNKAEARLHDARSSKTEAERVLESFCRDHARLIKDTLRSSGSNLYNNYDKRRFRRHAEQMVAERDSKTHRLSERNRNNLLAQHRSSPMPRLSLITYRLPALQRMADEVSGLLRSTVVSKVVQELKDAPVLSKWIHEGLRLHRQRKAEQCLFCEQPLSGDRLSVLEGHFTAEYEDFMKRLDQQIERLEAEVKRATELSMPTRAELYNDLAAEYDEAEQSFRKALVTVRRVVEALLEQLKNKKLRPFEQLTLDVLLPCDRRKQHRYNACPYGSRHPSERAVQMLPHPRFVRTPSFLLRYFPLDDPDSPVAVEEALNRTDGSGIKLLAKLENFVEFLAERCTENERQLYLAALDRIQTGLRYAEEERTAEGGRERYELVANIRLAYGETKREDRQQLLYAFNTPFFPEILVASSVLAEGVDLHLDCRYVIHHDLSWNPSTVEQRTGRVDRIGAKAERVGKPINVFMPYVAGTQDEKMYRVVRDRERWFQVLMGENYTVDESVTRQLESRVPLPEAAAAALAFKLHVYPAGDS
jgi:hypothetical protein